MSAAPRTRRGLLFLVFLCLFPWAGQSAPLPDHDYATLARAAIDRVVVPAYAGHARAMRGLGPAIERHCMGDSAEDDEAVRAAFDEAMDAWQRAWPFGIGPVMRGAGRARIAFWPGRPGSATRQMRKVLRTRDESLLDPGVLAAKSVAIKDLQALERLLSTATVHSARTEPFCTRRRTGSRTVAESSGCGTSQGTGDEFTSGPVTGWGRTRFGCFEQGRGSRWPTAESAPIPTPAARS